MEQYDVLVVGSGGAGQRAALEAAHQEGLRVALITKIFPSRSATAMAQGGINGVLNNVAKEDTIEDHIFDTVKGSDYLADQDAVEFFINRCPELIKELDYFGTPFSRTKENKIAQRNFGGQAYPRTCYSADKTGHVILHTLYEQCLKENVHFLQDWYLLDIVKADDGSVGGVVAIDFRDNANPIVRKLDFDFTKAGYALCIIDSGADHADLSDEYSAIPMEMRQVAAHFGKEVLREVAFADFLTDMAAVRKKAGDRATLRAYHFLKDNQRAIDEAAALEAGDFDKFLSLVKESGYSSFMYLQNVYVSGSVQHQEVAYALAACEAALAGKGAYRVHGGGFAGTIQAFVPQEMLAGFVEQMEKAVGKGRCHVLSIRPAGGTELMKV